MSVGLTCGCMLYRGGKATGGDDDLTTHYSSPPLISRDLLLVENILSSTQKTMMLSTSHSFSKSSTPIPIPNDEVNCLHKKYTQSDAEHASKLAEWQDSQMYQRLLHGMFLSCQRSDYHPKAIRSLENLMQTQSLPLSSLEASSSTSGKQNEEWAVCSTCSLGGDGDKKETPARRISDLSDCWCRSSRRPSSPSYQNCDYSSSALTTSGAAPDTLQEQSKSGGDEEEDGIIFDLET